MLSVISLINLNLSVFDNSDDEEYLCTQNILYKCFLYGSCAASPSDNVEHFKFK